MVKVRHGVKVFSEGESWLSWTVVPAGDARALERALDDYGGYSYGGPGRRFYEEPLVRRGRTRTLVTQYSGLDI